MNAFNKISLAVIVATVVLTTGCQRRETPPATPSNTGSPATTTTPGVSTGSMSGGSSDNAGAAASGSGGNTMGGSPGTSGQSMSASPPSSSASR